MTLLENKSADIPAPREITTKPRVSDKIFRGIVTAGGLSSLVILGLILIYLTYQGFDVLKSEGLGFISSSAWQIVLDDAGNIDPAQTTFGIAAMLVGTMICATIAILIAVPISVLTALYLSFYAPASVRKFMVAIIDLMAAFPSVLFGIWGFFVLMPSVEYWGKLLHKYFGFLPFFKMEEKLQSNARQYPQRAKYIAPECLAFIKVVTIASNHAHSPSLHGESLAGLGPIPDKVDTQYSI